MKHGRLAKSKPRWGQPKAISFKELTFDQLLFNRPFPGYAQYRSPIKGMYMCSSGTHPGGGVMAAPGANAAREILADLKKPNTVPGGYADD